MSRVLRLPGGVDAVVRVAGAETGGAFTMLTDRAPRGWSLPAHRHDVSETIHVTSGRLEMVVDGERQLLEAGDCVHVRAGVMHSGRTDGDDPVERVVVFAPAGMEELFVALDALDDPAAALRLALEHGWRFE